MNTDIIGIIAKNKGEHYMKHKLTANRLQTVLNEEHMLPVELAEKTGVSQSSISQYINGSHKPGNINAGKMGEVLSVHPLWLMGFDVDMDGKPVTPKKKIYLNKSILTKTLNNVSEEIKSAKEQEINKLLKYLDIVEAYEKASLETKAYVRGALGLAPEEKKDVKSVHSSKEEIIA